MRGDRVNVDINLPGFTDYTFHLSDKITESELRHIIDNYEEEIISILNLMLNENVDETQVKLSDNKKYSIIIKKKRIYLWEDNKVNNEEKYNYLLSEIYQDLSYLDNEEQWLNDKISNQGLSTKIIDDFDY